MDPETILRTSPTGDLLDSPNRPGWLTDLDEDRTQRLDLRPLADCGEDPTVEILRATSAMVRGDILILESASHPTTLRLKLANHGFDSHAERVAADHWRLYFHRLGTGSGCGSCA